MLLYQDMDGYAYNSDTMFLYDFISFFNPKGRVLDVGSGCGVLGLLVARDFEIELFCVEKQEKHFFLTQKNAQINKIEAEVFHSDFLDFASEKKFDFIISNPPFYHDGAKQSQNEAIRVSRYGEFLPFDRFAKKVSSILAPRGEFVFCYDASALGELLWVWLFFVYLLR